MAECLDAEGFRRLFDDQAIVFANLPQGRARQLAEQTNERTGRGDGTLRTRAEFDTLFADLTGGAQTLQMRDDNGALTPEGRIVQELQQAAISAVCPGVESTTVDAAARSILQERGLGEAFGHGTGHGLGLDVHEEPRISRPRADLAQGSERPSS